MRFLYFLSFPFLLLACGDEADSADTSQDEIPDNVLDSTTMVSEPDIVDYKDEGPGDIDYFQIGQFEILEKITGDLDKDGVDETVVAYDTHMEGEMGSERTIYIYKATEGGGWEEWITSTRAIMPSESGGMMGDGFDGIEIIKGVLHVRHWGGSREKWSYTHKYRFQNGDFYLIGVTSTSGAPCDYWEDFDYNLSTGQVNFKREHESCPDEDYKSDATEFNSDFEVKLDELPKFKNIELIGTQVIDPYTGESCYY